MEKAYTRTLKEKCIKGLEKKDKNTALEKKSGLTAPYT